ncbi:MAG: CS1 type fimbrial major subunit [Pseudomonas sp.]|uniref:CS1 type fimbrial major subunit n=1 Tax=Pseudomonas sp. TaxID=306 RepID=UPI003D6FEFF1
MFKKIAFAAPLAVLALSSSAVFAAGEARHSISLVAHVPTNGFYVVPTDSDLVNKDQRMDFVPSTNSMREVNGFFDVRNNNGSVHASLESVPQLFSGANKVDLQVSFNNKVLTTTPALVVGEAESNDNYRAPINIKALGAIPPAGDYAGAVTMMFDAVTPVGP